MSGARPLDRDNPLMLAARYNDAEAEDHDIQTVLAKHGLDIEHARYVAEQRALRMVLIRNERMGEISQTGFVRISLTDQQRAQFEELVPVYIDAIFLGWRANQIADNEEAAP